MHEIEIAHTPRGLSVVMRPRMRGGYLAGSLIVILAFIGSLVAMTAALGSGGLWVSLGGMIALGVSLLGVLVPWAVFVGVWMTTGAESVTAGRGGLLVELSALGITWRSRRYAYDDMHDVRVEPRAGMNRAPVIAYVYDRGAVAFDHGARTVRCGRRLSVREGEQVLDALRPAIEDAIAAEMRADPGTVAPGSPRFKTERSPERLQVTMVFGTAPETVSLLVMVVLGLVPLALVMPLVMTASLAEVGAATPWVFVLLEAMVLLLVALIVGTTLMPREVATAGGGELKIKVSPTTVAWIPPRRFDVRYMHNLRRAAPRLPTDLTGVWSDYFKQRSGQIALGYGPEEHRFGMQIDAPEARMIAEVIEEFLRTDPAYGSEALEAYERGVEQLEEAAEEEREDEAAIRLPEPPETPPDRREEIA